MPGAFASLDTGFPNLSGNGSAEDKLRAVQDYLYQLLEQLRYSMNNLGAENFNENSLNEITGPIRAEISDTAKGLTTLIEVTAEGVRLDVRRDYAAEWASGSSYRLLDVVKVTAADNSVKFYKCIQAHTAAAGNKPPKAAYWTEVAAADVAYSRFDMNADAIRTEVTRATGAEGTLSSSITQTADSIKSTVASAQSKYDLSALPSGVSISAYGYGAPTVTAASGTVYLDQATGYYYTSNGSTWTRSANPLPMITTQLQSQITQLPGEIMLDVRGDYADEWKVWADAGQTTRMRYYPNDVVKVSSASAVAFYKCNTEHLSYSSTKPPSENWDAVTAPSVQSMIDANLNGITLAYNNTGVTGDNSSYIKLHKDGIDMGGGTIQMTNVKADSLTANAVNAIRLSADQITAGTLDAGQINVMGEFHTKVTDGNDEEHDCGYIGGRYNSDSRISSVALSSINDRNSVQVNDDSTFLRSHMRTTTGGLLDQESTVTCDWDNGVKLKVSTITSNDSAYIEFAVKDDKILIKKYVNGTEQTFDLLALLAQI